MVDNYYDNYGVMSGYNQIAPGRDVAKPRVPGQPGRPRTNPIQDAIMPPQAPPVGQAVPHETPTFRGAQQTIGAPPATSPMANITQAISGTANDRGFAPVESGGITGGQDVRNIHNQPQAPTYDTTKWDTDGYAAPSYIAEHAGGPIEGWDATKWADANHQTPKYVVGRILSSYDLKNPEQRAQAIADIQKAYPGTQFDGKDVITYPDGSAVDIFRAADAGVYAPSYQPVLGPGGKPLPQEGPSHGTSPITIHNAIAGAAPQGGSDYSARILQQVLNSLGLNPDLQNLAKQTYGI